MSNQKVKIPRSSDRNVVKAFRELGAKFGVTDAYVSALGFNQLGVVGLGEGAVGPLRSLLEHDSALIESMSFSVAGLQVAYYRGGNNGAEKSPIFDEVVLNNNQNESASIEDRISVVAYLTDRLGAFDPGRVVSGISEEQNQLLAIHQSVLERLESLNEDLIRKGADFRADLERQHAEKLAANEAEIRGKSELLEKKYRERTDLLDTQQRGVEETLKKIDDRNNTHVRRAIRDRMLEDVKSRIEKFGVSDATSAKRAPVRHGIILLMIAFAALLVWTAVEIHLVNSLNESRIDLLKTLTVAAKQPDPKVEGLLGSVDLGSDRVDVYLLWIRFTLFAFGLFGSILYYVKWLNRWAEQHSAAEFQLQQFYVDVNRANWVIESCLEWRKATSSAIPRELLESITRGLFTNPGGATEPVMHPADELASALVGSASKLKLNVAGNEIMFDKPSRIPRIGKKRSVKRKAKGPVGEEE